MPSLSFVFPFLDYWRQLREGTRDNIIGGVVVAVLIGVVTVFHKSLLAGFGRLGSKASPSQAQSPPLEFTLKVEGVQPTRSPPLQAPVETPVAFTSDIPRPPVTGFVARRETDGRDIVERLKQELAPERNQLIVLWGAGGVGKTTLAAETARLLSGVFAGRIMWISAEGRTDFSLSTLLDEIATYLGRIDLRQLVLERKDAEVHDALASSLAPMIVLDNFETISPEEQDKCAAWLAKRANCPALITSRDEVPHTRPIHILAMSLPEAREFLQLLVGQARNPRAFDGLDHEQIIKAGDRIPLVLQWVVKRIDSAKQPQAVLDELAHGEGEAAKRVFDRSFDLPQVGNDGRATLLALSLFVPSASRGALAEVAGFGSDTKRLENALQQLAELWLIETIGNNERLVVEGLTRKLTKARLTKDGQVDEFRSRFVSCFLNYAVTHEESTPENVAALENERDNLLSAMEAALTRKDWASLMQIRSVLGEFLDVHGYWEDAIKTGNEVLRAASEMKDTEALGRFSHNLAVIHQGRGDNEEARRLYDESLQINTQLGNQSGIASTLHQLGQLAQDQGDLGEARRLYDESLQIEKQLGNQSGIAISLHALGTLAEGEGNNAEAARLFREALTTFVRLKSPNAEIARQSLERVEGKHS